MVINYGIINIVQTLSTMHQLLVRTAHPTGKKYHGNKSLWCAVCTITVDITKEKCQISEDFDQYMENALIIIILILEQESNYFFVFCHSGAETHHS